MAIVYSPPVDWDQIFHPDRTPDPVDADDGCGADVLPWPGERVDMLCPEPGCDGRLVLRTGKFGLFYGCSHFPTCKGAHGAKPDGSPMGIPADIPTRKARARAHEFFNRIWARDSGCGLNEASAYAWLAKVIGRPVEKTRFAFLDKDDCEIIVDIIKATYPQVVTVEDRLEADDLFDDPEGDFNRRFDFESVMNGVFGT